MAQQKTFRTAFNGFNREDVVHYIEYMNAQHISQVNQLTSEAEFLRSKLAQAQSNPAQDQELREQLAEAQARTAELEAQLQSALAEKPQGGAEQDEAAQTDNAELEARLQAALAEKVQAEAERDEAVQAKARAEEELRQAQVEKEAALQAKAQAEAERDTAMTQQITVQCRVEQELEAYRRAERTERVARQRAEKVYHQVNGVLADATVKVDEAASQIGQLTELVSAQLAQLQTAVTGSKQALQDAAETMYAIRPSAEEE